MALPLGIWVDATIAPLPDRTYARTCAGVRWSTRTVGMSPISSSFAASTLPWPAMMPCWLRTLTALHSEHSFEEVINCCNRE